MPSYTVLGVSPDQRPWDSAKGGPMIAYKVTFTEHSDRPVEWSRKASSDAPKAGDNVDGTIDWNAQYGPKFKQEFQNKGGGGGWKPKDPAEIAAIQRQAAMKVSVQIAAAAGWWENFDPEDSAGQAKLKLFSRLSDWVQRDIQKGVKVALADAQTAQSYGQRKDSNLTGQSDVPGGAPQVDLAPHITHLGGEAA